MVQKITEKSIEEFLENKTNQIYLEYKVIYNNHKKLADLIFKTDINTPTVIQLFQDNKREELYKYLLTRYNKLREYSVRQLHFHTFDNKSFLRMHRPLKYGDDLSSVRPTVKYVNTYKEYIDGFEEGKIFNGFRFIYPLYANNHHIGSVEISFSSLFFIKEMIKNFQVKSNLMIYKDVVDSKVMKEEISNYVQSPVKEFYFQKDVIDYIKLNGLEHAPSKNVIQVALKYISKGKPFSLYAGARKDIITFIPLINPVTNQVVASLNIRTHDSFIENKNYHSQIIFISLELFILIGLIFVYKQLRYQIDLQNEVKQKTKELKKLNSGLEAKVQQEIEKISKKTSLYKNKPS